MTTNHPATMSRPVSYLVQKVLKIGFWILRRFCSSCLILQDELDRLDGVRTCSSCFRVCVVWSRSATDIPSDLDLRLVSVLTIDEIEYVWCVFIEYSIDRQNKRRT